MEMVLKRGSIIAMTIVAILVVWAAVTILSNASLDGFRFLTDPTGWNIGYSVLPSTLDDPYWWAILAATSNTIFAAIVSIVCATTLGFFLGLVRSSSNIVLSTASRAYVDIVRNIPVIVQVMFWYAVFLYLPASRTAIEFLGMRISNRGFYFPSFTDNAVVFGLILAVVAMLWSGMVLFRHFNKVSTGRTTRGHWIAVGFFLAALAGILTLAPQLPAALVPDMPKKVGLNFRGGMRIPIELAALVAAVTFYRGAFIGEVFRGGFRSVTESHIDAAKSLGLRPWMTVVKVRIPLALITIIPPLSSELIVVVKVTSIGILVGFNDLYAVSSVTATITGRAFEVLAVMVLIYLVINFSIAQAMNALNRRIALPGYET